MLQQTDNLKVVGENEEMEDTKRDKDVIDVKTIL